MRNITFLLALLCLCLSTINAQSPGFRTFDQSSGIIGTVQTMPTNAVADDFGPRNLAKTYWHGGIDFNTSQGAGEGQRWWMIVSPQAGIIADFDRLTHGKEEYKYGLVNVTDDEGNGSHTWAFWSCI
ncbi:MAG: hypothetical protein IPL08_05440 [Saprospiraceae bacterium]|nr:hypothetical protein [Saprospiraceae bacterium]